MFALIGKPLSHSFSASYFNSKFERERIDEKYILKPLDNIGELQDFILSNPNLRGFNVTIPYKREVMEFLDYLSPEANAIGAVNVVKVDRKENSVLLSGFNTDSPAFLYTLEPLLKGKEDVKALVLGTGGASNAIAYALESLEIPYTKVSRTKQKDNLSYSEVTPDIIKRHLLIVNTTPVGMYPHIDEAPPIPYEAIGKNHICYDVVYNPETTLFMRLSKENGAIVKNGLEMLHMQADLAWKIWIGN